MSSLSSDSSDSNMVAPSTHVSLLSMYSESRLQSLPSAAGRRLTPNRPTKTQRVFLKKGKPIYVVRYVCEPPPPHEKWENPTNTTNGWTTRQSSPEGSHHTHNPSKNPRRRRKEKKKEMYYIDLPNIYNSCMYIFIPWCDGCVYIVLHIYRSIQQHQECWGRPIIYIYIYFLCH